MAESRVALVYCDSYGDAVVAAVVARGVDLVGGMAGCIEPGERIVLKPNVLLGEALEPKVSRAFKVVQRRPAVAAARL